MSINDSRANDIPNYYLYQGDDGRWRRTSDGVTKEINDHLFRRQPFDTQGRAFYPQWNEPEMKTQTHPAWFVNAEDGEMHLRWTITVCDHKKTHYGCTPLGDGTCLQQAPLKMSYDPKVKMWTKVTPPNIATGEQMRKFRNPNER